MNDSNNDIKNDGENNQPETPGIQEISPTLPKGGGAFRGIGETFQPNAFSGTGSYGIPIHTTPARDFEPTLNLAYSSGSGNGPFGIGFNISLPSISRRTEKGIPRYEDTDIFVFSETGELVPRLEEQNGEWKKDRRTEPGEGGSSWLVTIYLPRVEAAFSKIEQWECTDAGTSGFTAGTSYWKITGRNNVTSIYGRDDNARVSNPGNRAQIFQWLLQEAVDARGNKIEYIYKAENTDNVPEKIYEQNRTVTANRYIERIKYGNYFDESSNEQFAFEVVFDYGEYDLSNLDRPGADPYVPVQPWTCRPDPFSTYRSGFEIRTLRLCSNIMMFHHFKEELGESPCLTRVTHIQYNESPNLSSAEAVTVTGYRRRENGGYTGLPMPTIELGFSTFDPPAAPGFKTLEVTGGSLPGYLDQVQFLPVDLNGEGLPGFLYSNKESTLYYQPEGDGTYSAPEPPFDFPMDKDIQSGEAVLEDLDGNGLADLVVNIPWKPGFYPRAAERTWGTFQPFESYPTTALDTTFERVDLVGNGRADLMQVQSTGLSVYYSEGRKGYSPGQSLLKPDGFPSPKGDYLEELVGFADMFGDGLAHRVSIQSGTVTCRPNLGYGRFGENVTFGNAPRFDGTLDIRRLLFADIDGTGTDDLVYVYTDRVEIYFNRSGNSFSDPLTLMLPEAYSEIDKIRFADILGNGTSCLVFTKIESTPRHYYYNFVGETTFEDGTVIDALKPYLLTRIDNNMGAVTYIQYCSSTKFYLEDKKAGNPRVTRLPFPVQVVESVIHLDRLNGSRYVNRFKYHDGYYDPVEREFRGFGYVETWDTEEFDTYRERMETLERTAGTANSFQPLERELYVEPVYTRTWYHTGAFIGRGVISKQYQSEYYHGDGTPYNLPDSILGPGISGSDNSETLRQAYAALKGTVIRSEVYGLDEKNEEKSSVPYTVDESNVEVLPVQPKEGQRYAVFTVNSHESISYQYDQNPKDPRIQQQFTLQTDPLSGEVEKSCTVFLPRRSDPGAGVDVYPEQLELKATADTNLYIDTPDNLPYRWRGIKYTEQQFQIFGLDLDGADYFSYDNLKLQVETALNNIVPYEGTLQEGMLQARQLTWNRTFYWDESQDWDKDNDGALPPGEISPQGLTHHAETAVFTTQFIQDVFQDKLPVETIEDRGGFIFEEENGYWWNKGLVQYYYKEPSQFYMPDMTQNPYAPESSSLYAKTVVDYRGPYYLSPVKVTQYLDASITNVSTLEIDYQAMQPYQKVDINNNAAQVMFDPLGQVIVSSLFGTEGETAVGGMRLYPYDGLPAQYEPRLTAESGKPVTFEDVLKAPGYYLQGASQFFFYNPLAWQQGNAEGKCQPVGSIELKRDNDYQTADGLTTFSCITTIAYTDGDGRGLETKLKVDPGPALVRKKGKKGDRHEIREIRMEESENRWQVSGRTVYNNKGNPTMLYLPYFTDTPDYETQREITDQGLVPPPTVTHYDPLQRVVRVDTPKKFFTRTEYGPWQETHWDEDDTVMESEYYIEFKKNYPPDPTQQQKDENDALDKAAVFYNTPSVRVMNNMGNAFLAIQDNLETHPLITCSKLDIQGRVLETVDPRLYRSNLDNGTQYYNFKYLYLMAQEQPLYIDSVDAGITRTFNNIYANPVLSRNARDYVQQVTYDSFQRPTRVEVVKTDEPGTAVFGSVVETSTYGESLPLRESQANNLRGQAIRQNDQSGVQDISLYSIRENPMTISRELTEQYDIVIDWKDPSIVKMEKESYLFCFVYDALGRVLSETSPDGSVTTNTYNTGGQLHSVVVDTAGDAGGPGEPNEAIRQIRYNASLQRTQIDYGSGVTTLNTYEDTTQRLIYRNSTRPDLAPDEKKLQNLVYTYDPVGNITRMRDHTYKRVFCNNQEVSPLSGYTYDAIYRLKKADGRQHPGIGKDIHINGFKQSKFGYLCPPDPNDYTKLQTYWEEYTYDASGNLVNKKHNTGSPEGTWSQAAPVMDNSNRLKDREYNAAGNLLTLELNNSVTLDWNYRGLLAGTGIIEREGGIDDADFFNYDSGGQRIRKVVRRMAHGGSVTQVEERIYLGNFEVKRIKNTDAKGESTILHRQTLRVMDNDNCVLILHHWLQDDLKREASDSGTWKQRYQLADVLGSVSLEVDAGGGVISYEEYFPYGGTSIIAGNDITEVKLKDYRYSGKERDDSTGLYYYGARYYMPWLGRWLNPDPAGTVDGLNLYAFARDNPISNVDPNGLMQVHVGNINSGPMRNLLTNGVQMNHELVNDARDQLINLRDNPDSTAGGRTAGILRGWLGRELNDGNFDATVDRLIQDVSNLADLYNRGVPRQHTGCCACLSSLWDSLFGEEEHVETFLTSDETAAEGDGTRTMMSVRRIFGAIAPITVYENNWAETIEANLEGYGEELQLYVAHTIIHEQFHKVVGADDISYIESQNEDSRVTYRPANNPSNRTERRGTRGSVSSPLLSSSSAPALPTLLKNADTLAGIVVQLGMVGSGQAVEYNAYRQRLNDNFQKGILAQITDRLSEFGSSFSRGVKSIVSSII